jgi:HEXXH motif-containing protein
VVGIFEGVYVHLHCVIALVRLLQGNRIDVKTRRDAAARLDELRVQAREGIALLRGHARFTEAGRGFLPWAVSALRDA